VNGEWAEPNVQEFWDTYQFLIEGILINIALAFSQYVVLRAGVFSVATAGLAGVGAYTAALLTLRLAAPFPVSLLAGAVAATAVSLVLGWPLARLRGIYQAVSTLAFVLVFQTVLYDLPDLTGGSVGLVGIPRKSQDWQLVLMVAVIIFILINISRTRVGRAFDAIRTNEAAAVSVGVSVRRYHSLAFGLSGLFAGIAGGFLAHQSYLVEPTQFGFTPVINILVFVVLGGTVSILGPIVGTVSFMVLPEIARSFADYRGIVVGIILLLVIVYLPDGIVDSVIKLWKRRGDVSRPLRPGPPAQPIRERVTQPMAGALVEDERC
jgi:branched-chain amino acid transport system permease protein